MSWSLKFNNIELSNYGLSIATNPSSLSTTLGADTLQLADGEYAAASLAPAKPLSFDIVVQATNAAQLLSYLDSIKRICGQKEAGQLILGIQDDRYYTARFESFSGRRVGLLIFAGELRFSADDPLAYAVSATTSGPHSITSGDITFEVAVEGSAYAKPVYTLTAGDALTGITLKVKNNDSVEEFVWAEAVPDDVGNGHLFVIDSSLWYATNNAASAMAKMTGQFPRLIPGITNHIKVTDFWDTNPGSMSIVYRTAYL